MVYNDMIKFHLLSTSLKIDPKNVLIEVNISRKLVNVLFSRNVTIFCNVK